jgi:hypothetical protein
MQTDHQKTVGATMNTGHDENVWVIKSCRFDTTVCRTAAEQGDDEVLRFYFRVEGFFSLWHNVGRFFCHGLNKKQKSGFEEKKYDPKRSFPVNQR